MAVLLCAASASAQTLSWDVGSGGTNTGGVIVSGSGNWDTVSSNWNNGSGDVLWTQTSTTSGTNIAIFGGGDGAYQITNSAQVAATNIFINNSGYTFSGSPIYLVPSGLLAVAAGKTVTFNCNFASGNNAEYYWGNSGAVINVTGNFGGQQPRFSGPTNCAYYFSGVNTPSVLYVLAPVYQTNGSITTSASFFIGYPGGTIEGTNYTTGSLTLSGGATATQNGGNMLAGRGGGVGTLTLLNGTVNVGVSGSTARSLVMCNDSSGSERGTVNVYGGTVNVGVVGSTSLNGVLALAPGGCAAGEIAILNQTNGVINAWGGIEFGASTGTYSGGSAFVTNSGGFLYIGTGGIFRGAVYPPTNGITLSGGTVGALGNWSSALPMNLGTLNGNITFQCADNNNDPYSITLSGPLTGAGGLNLTGGGTLTLGGTNNFAGSVLVSNGTLVVKTLYAPTNGPVTVDGSLYNPVVSVALGATAQSWSMGNLTYQFGSPTADFNYGISAPSTTVAPIIVNGNLALNTIPNFQIDGSAIPVGTFPLIQYTGSLSGTALSSAPVTINEPGASGYVTNLPATKTIAVVVTSSLVTPAIYWATTSGTWDFTSYNWQSNTPPVSVEYADGDQVILDDLHSGAGPITITLNTLVQPTSLQANNPTKSYTISGKGSIAGIASVAVTMAGGLTLAGTNAYTGGTMVASPGQLNINNGGDSSGQDSAIGTGPLTLNPGSAIDNTSGSNVTLQPLISQYWNGNFTYVGSSNSLNTGPGTAIMNANIAVTVNSNNFIIGGQINDNGEGLKLTKAGNGTLTLAAGNAFSGGFELLGGQGNFGDPNAAGQGLFTIDGGSIDNSSGAPLTLNPSSYIWFSSFAYVGSTTNILDLGVGPVVQTASLTITVISNTLECDQDIQSGNQLITKAGPGTLIIGGNATSANQLGMAVIGGTLELARTAGFAIANTGGAARGLIVESNSLVLDVGNGIAQLGHGANVPLTLETGGVFDLNGNSETVDSLIMNGGTLQNENTNISQSSLSIVYAGGLATLEGTNNQFNVGTNASLTINATITGAGTLTMNGPGTLDLTSNETYTGATMISNGTLALPNVSSISNTASIMLATTNAALDMSQNTDMNGNPTPLLTLQTGQVLGGFGVVTGSVTTVSGATLSPGSGTATGTLTVTGDVTMGGNLSLSLNRNGGSPQSSRLAVGGATTYGGTLSVTNIGAVLQVGDKFQLFPSAITGFAGINLATTDAHNATYTWINNVAVDGSITVATVSTVNPLPGTIQARVSGNTLTLGWPTNAGWLLQIQTNSLAGGLGANWVTSPGSGSSTNMIVPLNPTNGSVFYRMVHP